MKKILAFVCNVMAIALFLLSIIMFTTENGKIISIVFFLFALFFVYCARSHKQDAKQAKHTQDENKGRKARKQTPASVPQTAYSARPAQRTVSPERLSASASAMQKKLDKLKAQYESLVYVASAYQSGEMPEKSLSPALSGIDEFSSVAPLDFHCLSILDLQKKFRENEKEIAALCKTYESQYSTKTNAAIYRLMVLGMEAELQNILTAMKFGKLEDAQQRVRNMTSKYYHIVADGNQTIANTANRFIAQLEYFYLQAVSIEYEYYTKKEQEKEERRYIREQARQAAADRRANEEQQRKLAEEAKKYDVEITRLTNAMAAADQQSEEYTQMQRQLENVMADKEQIAEKQEQLIQLQNGKAGTVYVISNEGAFGKNVFKVGMTRREEWQDRIDELGDASVPFPFDVHSHIFTNDAPALETALHHRLDDMRVNKVNMRKEFFRVSLDEIEQIVHEVDPTAEFVRTVPAEQYNQSLSA